MARFTAIMLGVAFALTVQAQTRTSVATGNWSAAATWDCNCVPASNENAVIASGHTVTLTANTTINDLTIQPGATFDNVNMRVNIDGSYTNNGDHAGSGNTFLNAMLGGGIDGAGTISNTGLIRINNGDKTIAATANLIKQSGNVIIGADLNLLNDGVITLGGNIRGVNSASRWVNRAGSTLNAGNTVMAIGILDASAAGNTVNYYSNSANENIKLPSGNTYHNLTLSGNGNKNLTGNTIVAGDLTMDGTLDVTISNHSLDVRGNWNAAGLFTERSGTVTFSGTGSQAVSSTAMETFYNLTVDKSSGTLDLAVNVTVSNTLTMTAGNILTGSYTLTLGTGIASPGTIAHTSGTIAGAFERWINATGTGILFPIGTASYYRPAIITFTGLTPGSLTASFSESAPGISGLPLDDGITPDSIRNTFSEGYWALTAANGLASANYALELTGNGFISFTVNDATRILKRTSSANPWTMNGTHVAATGSTARRSAVSGLSSEFAFGDTSNCDPPVTSAISGADSVCTNAAGSTYSVTNTPGSTYNWTATGGAIASGQGTDSITVNWGATGMAGSVSVTETNACTQGAAVTLTVNIHTIAPASITGRTAVAENTGGEPYSVTASPGYTYTWVITGGSIASGQGTNSITVNWGPAGGGNVRVTANSACGAAAPVDLPVNIYAIINSVGTGDWGASTTWDCTCIPLSTDNVQIKTTHTVTLSLNTVINNLVIEAGGTLFDNNRRMTVTGDLTVNGTYTGSNLLTMNGSNKTLSGTGTISTSGNFRFGGSAKVIASTANITRSPGNLQVWDGVVVTSNGRIVLAGDLVANNAASTWINGDNARLTVGGALLATGNLSATAAGNTVEYNGATGQSIKPTDYYNVSSTGVSTLSLTTNTNIEGNLIIGAGNTLNTNNYNVNVAGNWTNSGGTFNAGTGTVIFDGSSTQVITAGGGQSFNNVTVSSGSTVNVQGGTAVTVNGTLTNSGTIGNDGTLILPNGYSGQAGALRGNGTHRLTGGNWNPSPGVFTAEESTVEMNGTAAQTVAGNNTFNNLTINNAGGVSVSSGSQSLSGTLTPVAGSFSTNNSLTLLSTASKTARIDSVRTAAGLSGTITMQRYVTGNAGFRNIGVPVTGATFVQLNDDVTLTGMSGTGNGFENYWPSTYWYDEDYAGGGSIDSGWVAVTNVNDAMDPDKGYSIWIYNVDLPTTLDITGTPYVGNKSFPLTYDNRGNPIDDGWNLVNNPYPSSMDWDHASVAKNGSVNNAIYIWRDDIQQYASYVFGIGTNGGTQYIPSTQAFWVQTGGAGPALSTRELSKSPTDAAFYSMALPEAALRVTLRDAGGKSDETVVQFTEDAGDGFDPGMDARKLWSRGYGTPNIASLAGSDELSINRLPAVTQDVSIPLMVLVESAQSYTLAIDGVASMPLSSCISLEDLNTGTITDLRTTTAYSAVISDTDKVVRFLLHITAPVEKEASGVSCNGRTDGSATVKGKGPGPWNYLWMNGDGDTLRYVSGSAGADTLAGLAPGAYRVAVTNNGTCGDVEDTVVITEPLPVITDLTKNDMSCSGTADGSLSVNTPGTFPPYLYQWSDGATEAMRTGLTAASYSVTVTDAAGCTSAGSAAIAGPAKITASFTTDKDTVILAEDPLVIFTNTSVNASACAWDFGDGATDTSFTAAYHVYSSPGVYTVSLVADPVGCSDTAQVALVVMDSITGATVAGGSDEIRLFHNGRNLVLHYGSGERAQPGTVTVYNMLGKKVHAKRLKLRSGETAAVALPALQPGAYVAAFVSGNRQITHTFTVSE